MRANLLCTFHSSQLSCMNTFKQLLCITIDENISATAAEPNRNTLQFYDISITY